MHHRGRQQSILSVKSLDDIEESPPRTDFPPPPLLVPRSSAAVLRRHGRHDEGQSIVQLTVQVETVETAREQKKKKKKQKREREYRIVYECDRLDDRHNGLIVADMFSK